MNAKELRIGNLVLRNADVYCIGTGEDIGNCDFDKPIPLTEEWLKKFGFERKETLAYTYYQLFIPHYDYKGLCTDMKLSITCSGGIEYGNAKGKVFINDSFMCIMESINQLQNLYFALTCEELSCV